MIQLLQWLAFSWCLLSTSGEHEADPSDPSCLLSLRGRDVGALGYDSGYDPWKKFMESYEEVVAYNTMRDFTIQVASLGPVIGVIANLLLTVFWSSKSAAEALIQAVLDWTKHYVSEKILNLLKGLIKSKLNFVQSELKWYEHGIQPVKDAVEKGLDFPAATLIQAVNGPLVRAKSAAKQARFDIFEQTEYRGQVLQMYVLASSLQLSCVREFYIATVYYEKYMGEAPPWGSPETVAENMKVAYDEIESQLVTMSAEWQDWRSGSFLLEDNSYKKKSSEEAYCARFNLVDPFRPQDDKEWGVECYEARRRWGSNRRRRNLDYWIDRPKMQDNLRFMHIRNLKIKELVPILKSFAAFSKLIPGQEELPMKRGKVLPETIEVGPVSTWINGAYSLRRQDEKPMAYPKQPLPDIVSFNEMWTCMDEEFLRRFVFCKDFKTKRCSFGYGNCQGSTRTKLQAIGDPCGLSLSYGENKMLEWFFLYPDNGTKSWSAQNPDAKFGGAFCSGAGLCGLYKWDGMTKAADGPLSESTTGYGWMMSFKWLGD